MGLRCPRTKKGPDGRQVVHPDKRRTSMSIQHARMLTAATLAFSSVEAWAEMSMDQKFESFKLKFGKVYPTVELEATAKRTFVENDHIIQSHNSKKLSYWLGHNTFSDLTWPEFKEKFVGKISGNPTLNRKRNFDLSLLNTTVAGNSSVDWVAKGAVRADKHTPV